MVEDGERDGPRRLIVLLYRGNKAALRASIFN